MDQIQPKVLGTKHKFLFLPFAYRPLLIVT